MSYSKLDSFSTEKLILILIGSFTLLAFIFIIIFASNEQKTAQGSQTTTAYSTNDSEKPKVETSTLFFDMGKINVKDERKADFTIKNSGTKPLQLFKISSSCDCTFGKVTINGKESPEFTMHSKNPWVGTIDSGKMATLTVIYRPFIMPVKGLVTRDVYMSTNDPEKSTMTFTIKADVE